MSSSPEFVRVEAYSISGTIPLKAFAAAFPGKQVSIRKTEIFVSYEGNSWVVAHDFGAIVFFDIPKSEQTRLLGEVKKLVGGETRAPYSEEYTVQVSSQTTRSSVFFDRIDVPALTKPIVELVALVVGQSVAMEFFEDDVDNILREIDRYADELAMRGRFTGSSRELLQFVGKAAGLRNRAMYTIALLDSPAVTWNDEALDQLHQHLRGSFGVRDRYDALDHKLGAIRDALDLFVEMTRERRTFLLEFVVIVLILVEVVLALVSLARGH